MSTPAGNSDKVLFAAYDGEADASYACSLLESMGLHPSKCPKVINRKNRYFVYIENPEEITGERRLVRLNPKKSTTEYMLAVYNSASADFRRNEDFGDRRVNLYITLATAVLGGLIVLVTRQFISSPQLLIPAVAFGIAVVVSIGVGTFLRIIERNKATDEYIRSMRDAGKFFILSEPSIKPFLNEFDPFSAKKRRSEKIKLLSPATGGYLQTVAMLNSLVAASLPLLIVLALNVASGSQDASQTALGGWDYSLIVSSLFLFIGSWWFQINYAKGKYEEDELKWSVD